MRITILNQFYPPDISPTAKLAASLATHRAKKGDDVCVITSAGNYTAVSQDSQAHEAKCANLKVLRVWTPCLGRDVLAKRVVEYLFFYCLTAIRLLVMPAQDVIISLTTPPLIGLAALLHRLLHPRTRLVLWNMDCYPDVAERTGHIKAGGIVSKTLRAINQVLFHRLDHVICLDSAMQSLITSQYDRTGRLTSTIIPNWEPLGGFPPTRLREMSHANNASVTLNDNFTILYSGNMGQGHEFDTVLAAARELSDESISFVFAGGGVQSQHIGHTSRILANVVLRSYTPLADYITMLAHADCALVTLRADMAGIMSPSKLHASLAMALPVIYVGPEQSNVDDAIRRFGCGISVRQGDTQPLLEFIRRLRRDRRYYRQLRIRARHAFVTAYNDKSNLQLFDKVLGDVTSERSDRQVRIAAHVREVA